MNSICEWDNENCSNSLRRFSCLRGIVHQIKAHHINFFHYTQRLGNVIRSASLSEPFCLQQQISWCLNTRNFIDGFWGNLSLGEVRDFFSQVVSRTLRRLWSSNWRLYPRCQESNWGGKSALQKQFVMRPEKALDRSFRSLKLIGDFVWIVGQQWNSDSWTLRSNFNLFNWDWLIDFDR